MTPKISLSDALLENERLRLQVARLTDENALLRRQLAEYQVHPASVFASVQQVTNELEEPDTMSPFFDGKSFATTFRKDISQARRSVIIACPKIALRSSLFLWRLGCWWRGETVIVKSILRIYLRG